jgi:hypothetical protein
MPGGNAVALIGVHNSLRPFAYDARETGPSRNPCASAALRRCEREGEGTTVLA